MWPRMPSRTLHVVTSIGRRPALHSPERDGERRPLDVRLVRPLTQRSTLTSTQDPNHHIYSYISVAKWSALDYLVKEVTTGSMFDLPRAQCTVRVVRAGD